MHVLVTGGAGLIGSRTVLELTNRGHDVAYTIHEKRPSYEAGRQTQMDITDRSGVLNTVSEVGPDVIIHTAAMSDADECERYPDSAHKVNVVGTENVVRAAEQGGSRVVFLSSSFVFDGQTQVHYEDDRTSPVNVYGETKVAAERIVTGAAIPSVVIRTDQPYGWPDTPWGETMVMWLCDQLSERETVPVFKHWYNNPILLRDLVAGITLTIRMEATGVYHAVGPEYVNRYEWAKVLASALGFDSDRITPTESATADIEAERPNANLCISRLRSLGDWKPAGILEAASFLAQNRNII